MGVCFQIIYEYLYACKCKLTNKQILLLTAQLKAPLDQYIQQHFSKIRIIRAQKREGLIRARLLGAKASKGEILLFLDSHTEANVNWLPPLLGNTLLTALSNSTCVTK